MSKHEVVIKSQHEFFTFGEIQSILNSQCNNIPERAVIRLSHNWDSASKSYRTDMYIEWLD